MRRSNEFTVFIRRYDTVKAAVEVDKIALILNNVLKLFLINL